MRRIFLLILAGLFFFACDSLESTDNVKYAVNSGRLIKSISCSAGRYFFTYDDQYRISTMVYTNEYDVEYKYSYRNDGNIEVTRDKWRYFYETNHDGQLASYSIYIDNELVTTFEFSYSDGCLDSCSSGSNTFYYSWNDGNIVSVSDMQYFSYTDIIDNFNVPIPFLTLPYYSSGIEINCPMVGKLGSEKLASSVSTGTESYDFVYSCNEEGDIDKIELGTLVWEIEYYTEPAGVDP